MPRLKIYLDQDVIDRLKTYTETKYGQRRAISIAAQLAISRFLDEENVKSAKKKPTRPKAF